MSTAAHVFHHAAAHAIHRAVNFLFDCSGNQIFHRMENSVPRRAEARAAEARRAHTTFRCNRAVVPIPGIFPDTLYFPLQSNKSTIPINCIARISASTAPTFSERFSDKKGFNASSSRALSS